MEIVMIKDTKARHADQFEDGEEVFRATHFDSEVRIVAESWNVNHKAFVIYVNWVKITSSSNYMKAIGEAVFVLCSITNRP